jgi:hypothetical protein
MQVFLGDIITLINETINEDNPSYVTGQVRGIVLSEHKQVSHVFIHGLDRPMLMSNGWKFLDHQNEIQEEEND